MKTHQAHTVAMADPPDLNPKPKKTQFELHHHTDSDAEKPTSFHHLSYQNFKSNKTNFCN